MYHRHFTHALLFVPFGALLIAAALWPLLRKYLSFKWIYIYAFAGMATHGIVDSTTSYGTHLMWPIDHARTAWSIWSIIDPIVLLLLIIGVVAYVVSLSGRFWAAISLSILLYGGFGAYQMMTVKSSILKLAETRGDEVVRHHAQPTLFNSIVWRGIYTTTAGDIHVDGYRVTPLAGVRVYPGSSVKRYRVPDDLDRKSALYNDIKRFSFFSNDYLGVDPINPNFLGDLRYAMLPNAIKPLWAIEIDLNRPDHHIHRIYNRHDRAKSARVLWKMLKGQDGYTLSELVKR